MNSPSARPIKIIFRHSSIKSYYNQFAHDLRLFLTAVVGRPLSACMLMFSGIYARTRVGEWMSSSILSESLRKRDADMNGLRKEA